MMVTFLVLAHLLSVPLKLLMREALPMLAASHGTVFNVQKL